MATTTNYGWDTPDDTDLVKDGAAAIRTLGSSVDTTTKALNPETTLGDIAYRSATSNTNTRLAIGSAGQVLTVAAGVPSWASPSDQTPLTTKGDVFTFSTVDARLGVGANGTVLTADSAEATGLKWVAPAGSSKNWSLVNAGGTALTGAATITVSGISGADEIMVLVAGGSTANTGSFVSYRFNGDTGSNYFPAGSNILAPNAYDESNFRNKTGAATTEIIFSRIGADAGAEIGSGLIMSGCNSSGVKVFNVVAASYSSTNNEDSQTYILNGIYSGTSTISSVSVISSSGNWDAGTIYVYKTA